MEARTGDHPETTAAEDGPATPPAGGATDPAERIADETLAFLSLDELLNELLERVRTVLEADTAVILLLDRNRERLVARAAKGIEEEVRLGVTVPVGAGFAGRVAAHRHPIRIPDLHEAEIYNPLLRRRGLHSLLGVPLLIEGDVIGVMHAGTLERREFSDEDERVLQAAADRAADAVDRARRAEQRTLTQIMQRALLPSALPGLPGLKLSGKYLPAASELALGGDWYDVIGLPDGRVAFVIGDVVGNGVEAAATMSEIRSALRAYAVERHEPESIVGMLNELLVALGGGRSATMLLMTLDFETDELRSVNAGHPPAALLAPGAEPRFIAEPSGPPLGLHAGAVYDVEAHAMETGSTLMLYTDGLVERRGESLDQGLERLVKALVEARESPNEDHGGVADHVIAALTRSWVVDDDVAVLVIESEPLGDTLSLTLEARATVLSGMRRALARWMRDHHIADEDRFAITMACSEAAANAIEHAYGPSDAQFTLDGTVAGDEVRILIGDAGEWRPRAPADRGRGLQIMSALMDDVDIRSQAGGTVVEMRKQIGPRT